MRVYVRTDPALIRAVLADAAETTAAAAAARAGVGPDTISSWRKHAARLGDWPNEADVTDWHAQEERRRVPRERDDRYRRRRYFNQQAPLTTDPTGSTRRLRALHALGFTWDAIAAEAGVSKHQVWRIAHGAHCSDRGVYRATAEWVREVYDRLCMTRPQGWTADRARGRAVRLGWAPPLAWNNIDDPAEQPSTAQTWGGGEWENHIDPAVVWRVVNEQTRPRKLTHAEAAESVRTLLARGVSTFQIENDYGLKPDRYITSERPEKEVA